MNDDIGIFFPDADGCRLHEPLALACSVARDYFVYVKGIETVGTMVERPPGNDRVFSFTFQANEGFFVNDEALSVLSLILTCH